MRPTIGRIVVYASRTGDYTDVPAIVNATEATLKDDGTVPSLSSEQHVHLTVFTPEQPDHPDVRLHNITGVYQEFDVPHDPGGSPGTWRWPGHRT